MDIAIIDFGSQYTNLIRAQLDDLGISNGLVPASTPTELLMESKGIIVSGGPSSVLGSHAPDYAEGLFEAGIPILGICYGHQLMAAATGGTVSAGSAQEYGRAALRVAEAGSIFSDLSPTEAVWMSHSDTVMEPPPGFTVAASTSTCPVAAMYNESKNLFGVQFHPEISQTEHGAQILNRFAVDICKCEAVPNVAGTIEALKQSVRDEVGENNVLLLLSGGVDSNVAFVLLAEALGKSRVLGLHVDTGLLRRGETEDLLTVLTSLGLDDRVKVVDARQMFFSRLRGVRHHEEKRRVIANTFLDAKDLAMQELALDPDRWLVGQGTIYTDLITSGLTEHAKTIKTHHNSLFDRRSALKLIEPLRTMYKHQVRAVGAELGLPHSLIWKEPYPGPGSGVRILGEVTEARAQLQQRVDSILFDILRTHKYEEILFQGFPVLAVASDLGEPVLKGQILGTVTPERESTVKESASVVAAKLQEHALSHVEVKCILLPFETVGIKGDNRALAAPLALYLPSAQPHQEPDYNLIEGLSSAITNEVDSITRVVLDITPAKPEETPWETLVFLRLVTSREAMTADWAKIEYGVLTNIAKAIVQNAPVDRVMLDVTQKPPGMIEWE